VAIIMDGNGRWASERGLPRCEGHRAGITALRDVLEGAAELGLANVTLYMFSTENWQRSAEEVRHLLDFGHEYLQDGAEVPDGYRFRWAGIEEGLPDTVVAMLRRREAETQHHIRGTVTACLNYGGRTEIATAAAALARDALAGTVDPVFVPEHLIARYLHCPGLPDVDLLWRTGGEHRISNFLPWQVSYAELHFTDQLWPEVDRRDLWQAVTAYTRRDRRRGAAAPGTVRVPRPTSGEAAAGCAEAQQQWGP
jgi:undecaprenyl diphosphate synthase